MEWASPVVPDIVLGWAHKKSGRFSAANVDSLAAVVLTAIVSAAGALIFGFLFNARPGVD
jgi:hypothetical protein